MHPDIANGLLLMAVGMITVFIALGLVVGIGHGLILIVNRFAPPSPLPIYPESEFPMPTSGLSTGHDPAVLAVIVAAVEAATGGKGKVVSATLKTNN